MHSPFLKVYSEVQAVHTPRFPSQVLQLLTWQGWQAPFTSPKPGRHPKHVPTNWQEAQLFTPQLVQRLVESTKNPGEQLAHSLAELQEEQLATLHGSQLVEPAVLRVKPASQAVQLLLVCEQLMQLSMLQPRHWAKEAERVNPGLH